MKSVARDGIRLPGWFVSLGGGTGSIQAPGPNHRRYERPLAARRAWRVGVMNQRRGRLSSGRGARGRSPTAFPPGSPAGLPLASPLIRPHPFSPAPVPGARRGWFATPRGVPLSGPTLVWWKSLSGICGWLPCTGW
ncbi:hypothetical protein GZL_05507 [Streptomyces sp. 769]|nr:hypothetical protein GZL_05507 [Streptomyces sp. 769]